jgi:hybrid cluster-associated redox disulfide protein
MDTNEFLYDRVTVEEVLQKWPETWEVFKSRKTHCMGCFLQRFCSLKEVAEAYQLPLGDLIGELEKYVNQSKNLKGVSHENCV